MLQVSGILLWSSAVSKGPDVKGARRATCCNLVVKAGGELQRLSDAELFCLDLMKVSYVISLQDLTGVKCRIERPKSNMMQCCNVKELWRANRAQRC